MDLVLLLVDHMLRLVGLVGLVQLGLLFVLLHLDESRGYGCQAARALQTKDLSEQLATDQPFGDREIGVLGDWGVRGFGAHSSRVSNPINRRLIDEQHCT